VLTELQVLESLDLGGFVYNTWFPEGVRLASRSLQTIWVDSLSPFPEKLPNLRLSDFLKLVSVMFSRLDTSLIDDPDDYNDEGVVQKYSAMAERYSTLPLEASNDAWEELWGGGSDWPAGFYTDVLRALAPIRQAFSGVHFFELYDWNVSPGFMAALGHLFTNLQVLCVRYHLDPNEEGEGTFFNDCLAA
jgi:hypothetical protein